MEHRISHKKIHGNKIQSQKIEESIIGVQRRVTLYYMKVYEVCSLFSNVCFPVGGLALKRKLLPYGIIAEK